MNQRVHTRTQRPAHRASTAAARPSSTDARRFELLRTLQHTAGNRAVARLLATDVTPSDAAGRLVVQRDVDSAATELRSQGIITVKNSHLKAKFLRDHGITKNQIGDIQARMDELRGEGGTTTPTVVDMSLEENWRTEGGMREDEAAGVARANNWTVDNTNWRCRDVAHTPKGRVYTNGDVYYGADNTGHVGWGFKIWTRDGGTWLRYAGNMVWTGTAWNVIPRGT